MLAGSGHGRGLGVVNGWMVVVLVVVRKRGGGGRKKR